MELIEAILRVDGPASLQGSGLFRCIAGACGFTCTLNEGGALGDGVADKGSVFFLPQERENSSSVTCECPRARSRSVESGATAGCGAEVVLREGKLMLGVGVWFLGLVPGDGEAELRGLWGLGRDSGCHWPLQGSSCLFQDVTQALGRQQPGTWTSWAFGCLPACWTCRVPVPRSCAGAARRG